jgi:hypothetical protein
MLENGESLRQEGWRKAKQESEISNDIKLKLTKGIGRGPASLDMSLTEEVD